MSLRVEQQQQFQQDSSSGVPCETVRPGAVLLPTYYLFRCAVIWALQRFGFKGLGFW